MRVFEQSLSLARAKATESLFTHFSKSISRALADGEISNRFLVNESDATQWNCEIGVIDWPRQSRLTRPDDIFRFARRRSENTNRFTAALVVPTGVGAEVGGHAGDAMVVCRLLSEACDQLITHPNVVNASDINEIPDNALYVEGSILTRLLMGTIGLQPVRFNRVIVLIDDHEHEIFTNAAINAVNAARATYGLVCPKVVKMSPPIDMRSEYQESGRASGEIFGFERVLDVLLSERPNFDAVAISSVIQVPPNYHQDYFDCDGSMVNPWGGVEAMLTHAISSILNVPSAHSPMFESEQIANADPGVVEPRMAAEAISTTFLQCVLKGLRKSPRIVTDSETMKASHVVTADDVSCLVIPEGCLGLPTLAALEQGIPVIAVRENKNLMKNDLSSLPWAPGQYHLVENYWEAVGVMTALKAGISPQSVRRPISYVEVQSSGMNAAARLRQKEGEKL